MRPFANRADIAAAVSFAGVGPEHTRLKALADPVWTRNFHRIEVEKVATQFEAVIDNVLTRADARVSRLPTLNAIASLRGLVEMLSVGV